jgi:hypothetical protein
MRKTQLKVQSKKQLSKLSKQRGKARAAADGPPLVMLSAEEVVAQLRALKGQIEEVEPLTPEERAIARSQARLALSHEAVQASINAIGKSDVVMQAVGSPAEEARQVVDDTNRWTAVEDELKGLLAGISDANLTRRQRTAIVAVKAYLIAKQVARDNPELRVQVEEIKRLRNLARRKKTATQAPQTPPAPTTPAEAPSVDLSTESKK